MNRLWYPGDGSGANQCRDHYPLLPSFSLFFSLLLSLRVFLVFKIVFLWVALDVLELCKPGWPRTQRSDCLCCLSVRIKGVYRHLAFFF